MLARVGALLLVCAVAAAQEGPELVFGKKPFQVRPLQFEVAVPDGWQAQHDHTGFVAQEARKATGPGFQVSREPLLHREDDFAAAWQAQLKAAGVTAEVRKVKARSHVAWKATWSKGGRAIEVWRMLAPATRMLYNFSFSTPADYAGAAPLVKGVVQSFKCTAPKKAKLRFNRTTESLGTRGEIHLPEGYEKVPPQVRFQRRGGHGFELLLPGYKPHHVAGGISLQAQRAGARGARLPDNNVVQGGTDDIAKGYGAYWHGKLREVKGKPRVRSARFGGFKGHSVLVQGKNEKGLPKQVFVFAGKQKQLLVVIDIMVDERETLIYKDLFKQMCSQLKMRS